MLISAHWKGAVSAFAVVCLFHCSSLGATEERASMVGVTANVKAYAITVLQPALGNARGKDKLSVFQSIIRIFNDPAIGIHVHAAKPRVYVSYGYLEKVKLGFLVTLGLTPGQKTALKNRYESLMKKEPSDVFFAPSADEVIGSRAALGCSHYARSFIGCVKALQLTNHPTDLRYVVSCKSDDYERARDEKDADGVINGHQFVMVQIKGEWIALNTSKGDWYVMPDGFSPDAPLVGANIPIAFPAYKGVTFYLRKIGRDDGDDCGDNSLRALMNIYRSGDPQRSEFKW